MPRLWPPERGLGFKQDIDKSIYDKPGVKPARAEHYTFLSSSKMGPNEKYVLLYFANKFVLITADRFLENTNFKTAKAGNFRIQMHDAH